VFSSLTLLGSTILWAMGSRIGSTFYPLEAFGGTGATNSLDHLRTIGGPDYPSLAGARVLMASAFAELSAR
jgi:hypothetical protein